MKMKKIAFIASVLLLSIGVAACGNGSKDSKDSSSKAASSASSEEVVTGASISDKPEDIIHGLGPDGNWIFALTGDAKLTEDLVVSGTFYDKNDKSSDVYRKLALYTQDADKKVTGEFKLTVPKMIVESPNFKIQNGTIVGDVQVSAEGFELADSTVEGNVTFNTQELKDSAKLDTGKVTGTVEVAK